MADSDCMRQFYRAWELSRALYITDEVRLVLIGPELVRIVDTRPRCVDTIGRRMASAPKWKPDLGDLSTARMPVVKNDNIGILSVKMATSCLVLGRNSFIRILEGVVNLTGGRCGAWIQDTRLISTSAIGDFRIGGWDFRRFPV